MSDATTWQGWFWDCDPRAHAERRRRLAAFWEQMTGKRDCGPGDRHRGGRGNWTRDDLFGPRGLFGADGPFGPDGLFGPRGPFGSGRPGHPRGRARKGDVRQAILALLAEQPMNGYQIMQTLEDRTQGVWKPSPGAVYPALSQLQDEGLVAETTLDHQRAFELTEAGRAAAETAEKPWEAVNEASQSTWHGTNWDAFKAYGDLAAAVQAVSRSGDDAVIKAATERLAEAKRALYALLAQDSPAPDDPSPKA